MLDRDAPLLFTHFERRYPYLLAATPPAEECLLVPFYVKGKSVGTIWAIAHDERRKFDAEDLRLLESLGRFASAAYQAVESLSDLDRRRDAVTRMEEAIESRQEMEKLNAELRESEERYRTLFELDPAAVYSCDASGVIQKFNRRAAELWGREPTLGDTDERFCGSFKLFLADGSYMPHAQCPMAKVVSGALAEVRDAEVLIERPDGSRVTVIVNIRPLKNEHGQITGAINCFYDVTERNKVERALRQTEERFRAMFDVGPIAIYSIDTSGAIREFNAIAVKLWGREPKRDDPTELYCGSLKLYLPDGTYLPHAQTPMADVLRGEVAAVHDVAVVIERPDASRITVMVNIVPLKNDRGEITGAMNCFYDITERSRLEKQAQEHTAAMADQNRRKDEFLAMLGHELRSPLAPISNAVQLLRLQKNDDPLHQQAHNVIERQVGQLKHLVDDLLEVSRITSGRVQLVPTRSDVRGIVALAVETVRPLIVQRRHAFTVSLAPQPVWANADAARLEQVVVNLLTNAAKYTDEGGHIFLTLDQEGDTSVLRVRDTGVGIAAELLPRIFDLFTQADRSLDRSQGGLGIGLCLVQRLVELHGGTVTVNSVMGKGSEFVVRLPILLASIPASPSPAAEVNPAHEKCCRVLAVDDNVDTAQTLAILLEALGHEVQVAYDGPSALEKAVDFRPDVVLLDIGLPGLNGYEVAKRIRQPSLKNMVLVAMTGYGLDADRQRSQDAGFDHHLVKPADFGEVQKILATVSQSRSSHKEPEVTH